MAPAVDTSRAVKATYLGPADYITIGGEDKGKTYYRPAGGTVEVTISRDEAQHMAIYGHHRFQFGEEVTNQPMPSSATGPDLLPPALQQQGVKPDDVIRGDAPAIDQTAPAAPVMTRATPDGGSQVTSSTATAKS